MINPRFGANVAGLEPSQRLLGADPLLYLDLTEGVRRGLGRIVYAELDGILIRFSSDDAPDGDGYAMACADVSAAERLCALLPQRFDFLLTLHDEFSCPVLRARYGDAFSLGVPCHQGAYLEADPLPLPADGPKVRPLEPHHLPQAAQTYHLGSRDYLAALIARGQLFGAFQEETMMAFIGCHDEGSMGLLEVLPPYRRRGLGQYLEAWLINHEQRLGHIPYCQIFQDNQPSLALQRKLGLTLSPAAIRWATPQ